MKELKQEEFLTRISDDNLLIPLDNYYQLYSLYHSLLTKYLKKYLFLDVLDAEFKDSDLNYLKVEENEMDVYQYLSSLDLNYFYVRNNLYLTNLNKEERDFLNNKLNSNNFELDEDTSKFITSTMKKVISSTYMQKTRTLFFGPMSSRFMANSDNLVIGFRYDEFNRNNMSDKEWDKNHNDKMTDINEKLTDYKELLKKIDIMPVTIIQYDETNIKKKDKLLNEKSGKTM